MLIYKNISIHLSCQQYECNSFEVLETESLLRFKSVQKTEEVICPSCLKNHAHVHDTYTITLKDVPLWIGVKQTVEVELHRYLCLECGKTFSEEVCFKYPGTRITVRAARWVQELLRWHLPISAVHEITGIHWETIRDIHKSMMEEALDWRKKELQDTDYKPVSSSFPTIALSIGEATSWPYCPHWSTGWSTCTKSSSWVRRTEDGMTSTGSTSVTSVVIVGASLGFASALRALHNRALSL